MKSASFLKLTPSTIAIFGAIRVIQGSMMQALPFRNEAALTNNYNLLCCTSQQETRRVYKEWQYCPNTEWFQYLYTHDDVIN